MADKPPFDGPYKKAGEPRKDKYGNTIKPKNLAKHLAKKAMMHVAKKAVEKKMKKEEVEEIDEISKKTLGSYINKASKSAAHKSGMAYRRYSRGTRADDREGDELEKKANKRLAGIATATKKLTKEEVEQIDEATNATVTLDSWKELQFYGEDPKEVKKHESKYRIKIKSKGSKFVVSGPKKGIIGFLKDKDVAEMDIDDIKYEFPELFESVQIDELEKKANKRLAGIATATKKLTKEEVEQLDEISPKLARRAAAMSSAKAYEYGNSAYDDESGKHADRLSDKSDKAYAHVKKRQGQKGVDKTNRLAGHILFGKSRHESVELDEGTKEMLAKYHKYKDKQMSPAEAQQFKQMVRKLKAAGVSLKEEEQVDEMKMGMMPKSSKGREYIDKKRTARQDQHMKQDPKTAKAGYARNIVDTDKAEKKAKAKGVTPRKMDWRDRNSAKERKLPEEVMQVGEEDYGLKIRRYEMIKKAAKKIQRKAKSASKSDYKKSDKKGMADVKTEGYKVPSNYASMMMKKKRADQKKKYTPPTEAEKKRDRDRDAGKSDRMYGSMRGGLKEASLKKRIANRGAVETELLKYARSGRAGIDKDDFIMAAKLISDGSSKDTHKFVMSLDTDPRDFILDLLDKRGLLKNGKVVLEGSETLNWKQFNEKLSPAQKKHMDTDKDGDIDGKDLATLRSKKKNK